MNIFPTRLKVLLSERETIIIIQHFHHLSCRLVVRRRLFKEWPKKRQVLDFHLSKMKVKALTAKAVTYVGLELIIKIICKQIYSFSCAELCQNRRFKCAPLLLTPFRRHAILNQAQIADLSTIQQGQTGLDLLLYCITDTEVEKAKTKLFWWTSMSGSCHRSCRAKHRGHTSPVIVLASVHPVHVKLCTLVAKSWLQLQEGQDSLCCPGQLSNLYPNHCNIDLIKKPFL